MTISVEAQAAATAKAQAEQTQKALDSAFKVFIGYDSREQAAFEVCAESIRRHSSIPVAIIGLKQDRLRERGLYTRPADEPAATEFAFTRFLVPHLCDYRGNAMFVDCDFLFTQDISHLLSHVRHAARRLPPGVTGSVAVVKHDYTPKAMFKMDGQKQVNYPRKNWSSLMVFNNPQCTTLTLEYVNESSPQALHRFAWAPDETILELPQQWNWLEGEYDWDKEWPPAGIHFTNGGPWHVNHKSVRFGDLWVHAHAELQTKREQRQ